LPLLSSSWLTFMPHYHILWVVQTEICVMQNMCSWNVMWLKVLIVIPLVFKIVVHFKILSCHVGILNYVNILICVPFILLYTVFFKKRERIDGGKISVARLKSGVDGMLFSTVYILYWKCLMYRIAKSADFCDSACGSILEMPSSESLPQHWMSWLTNFIAFLSASK
jgi:hypothetical protein